MTVNNDISNNDVLDNYIDKYTTYNSLLVSNLLTLSQIPINAVEYLNEKVNKLTNQNAILDFKVKEYEKKEKRKSCEDEFDLLANKKLKLSNEYKSKIYKKSKISYDDDKINEIFKNLKTIKDIIDLKGKWHFIKHNLKLQRLYYLIEPLIKLDNMIGLKNVKEDIFKTIIYYTTKQYTDEYLHTIINGPPGVGKTEFAKIYAEIFLRLGILKTNSFLEIKKDDLVAKYLGQTSHRTKELLEKGMGGVIFLDEAYSLGNEEKRDSFAKEAIDMINQYLSEKKDQFMFIIAGYEDDLENCFFAFNKGLKRRFSHNYKIDKYSSDELAEIFKFKILKKGYKIDIPDEKLYNFFKEKYNRFKFYAGDIEKLVNYIKYEQSFRCFKLNDDNNNITIDDLNIAIDNFKEPKNYDPPYGMYC
jgi:SpoVK/Ycf46/Vps4 family AAA+-type ATPase